MSPRKIFIFPLILLLLASWSPRGEKEPLPNNDSLLISRLEPYNITPNDFARKTFYTWTKPGQIEELRNGKELLSRSQSAKGELSRFDVVLADTNYNRFPIARMLREPRFSRKRFAWSCAWPTVMGWEKEKYGDQLLKITLKDDAIIVKFTPYCDTIFDYRDVNGKLLEEAYVLANRDKIAVVYFAGWKSGIRTQYRGTVRRPGRKMNAWIHYREYVLCNEQMIASWEYGTPAVKKEMEEETAMLVLLAQTLKAGDLPKRYYSGRNDYCVDDSFGSDLENSYSRSIAFPNDYYLMDPSRVEKISATMKRALAAQGAPLSR